MGLLDLSQNYMNTVNFEKNEINLPSYSTNSFSSSFETSTNLKSLGMATSAGLNLFKTVTNIYGTILAGDIAQEEAAFKKSQALFKALVINDTYKQLITSRALLEADTIHKFNQLRGKLKVAAAAQGLDLSTVQPIEKDVSLSEEKELYNLRMKLLQQTFDLKLKYLDALQEQTYWEKQQDIIKWHTYGQVANQVMSFGTSLLTSALTFGMI